MRCDTILFLHVSILLICIIKSSFLFYIVYFDLLYRIKNDPISELRHMLSWVADT